MSASAKATVARTVLYTRTSSISPTNICVSFTARDPIRNAHVDALLGFGTLVEFVSVNNCFPLTNNVMVFVDLFVA